MYVYYNLVWIFCDFTKNDLCYTKKLCKKQPYTRYFA